MNIHDFIKSYFDETRPKTQQEVDVLYPTHIAEDCSESDPHKNAVLVLFFPEDGLIKYSNVCLRCSALHAGLIG